MNHIECENMTVGYGKEDIIHQLSLGIPQGKVTAIIGANGCGKSTVLKSLSRLLAPKSGTVYLDGKEIATLSGLEIARKMAVLPQAPTAPARLTVEELTAYGRYPHLKGFGKLGPHDQEKIHWALEITGLLPFKDRDLDALSGGQRQRVWIAMALAQDSDLILLDEPTTYLDLVHQLEVLQLLQRLNCEEGKTVALVIHELNMAARFADWIIAVKAGAIAAEGPPEAVMTSKVMREVFAIDAQITEDPRTKRPVLLTYDVLK